MGRACCPAVFGLLVGLFLCPAYALSLDFSRWSSIKSLFSAAPHPPVFPASFEVGMPLVV
jgi:hypothetical protein